jgi:hypothetical protein
MTAMADETVPAPSWINAFLLAVVVSAVCIGFAFLLEAIAQTIGDF